MSQELSIPVFAYDSEEFTQEEIGELQAIASSIEIIRHRSIESILSLGSQLKHAEKILKKHHVGTFGKWVESHAFITRNTAYQYIKVVEVFGDTKRELLHQFHNKALYLLARETTPEEAIKDTLKLAAKGYVITKDVAEGAIAKYTVSDVEAVVSMPEHCPVCEQATGEEVNEWRQYTDGELRCVHCNHIYGETIGDVDEMSQEELEGEQRRKEIEKLSKAAGQLTLACSRLRIPNFKQLTLQELFDEIRAQKEELAG